MLTVHLAGLPVHTRSLPANKRREFMTSQNDIQWVDLCVFVHVTILCLSLANLSICKPPSIKHVPLPVSSPVRSSAALIPRLTVNRIDCALLISPRCLCVFGWLCICVILCLFYFLCENLVVIGGGHCVIGRFCMMYACLHPMIRTAGAFMMASQWIKLTRRFTQKRKFSWIIYDFISSMENRDFKEYFSCKNSEVKL